MAPPVYAEEERLISKPVACRANFEAWSICIRDTENSHGRKLCNRPLTSLEMDSPLLKTW